MSLQGKVFAITGGASGIGLATAKMLSSRGATVCMADIDPAAMEEASTHFSALSVPFLVTKVDVSKRSEVDSWIQTVVDKFGRLDGAANVAGVIGRCHGITPISDFDDEEWDKIIAVNLTGAMYCLRAQLRSISDGGSIVNVSSIHGVKGFALHGAYDASKHGLIGLTKAAAQENGHRGVRVNSVAPGAIYTPLMQKSWDFMGRPLSVAAYIKLMELGHKLQPSISMIHSCLSNCRDGINAKVQYMFEQGIKDYQGKMHEKYRTILNVTHNASGRERV